MKLTIYRDDSTAKVTYNRVKSYFWTAGNSVLTIAQYNKNDETNHHYIHWMRENVCWFKLETE